MFWKVFRICRAGVAITLHEVAARGSQAKPLGVQIKVRHKQLLLLCYYPRCLLLLFFVLFFFFCA